MPRKSVKPCNSIPPDIIGDLAKAFKKSLGSIMRWFDSEDDRLTSDKAKEVFAKHNFSYTPHLTTNGNHQ